METAKKIRTYSEMMQYKSFVERFRYLKLNGVVGKKTFGYDRWINQKFYTSYEWKKIRREIILRDNGCDLGVLDKEINYGKILVHHMNPILLKDIVDVSDLVLNPEYLITVSEKTHNAIHYGDESLLELDLLERKKGDTLLW